MKCPECGEPAKVAKIKPVGAMLNVDRERLRAAHLDGTPLCPVMTAKGYQPAMPIRS